MKLTVEATDYTLSSFDRNGTAVSYGHLRGLTSRGKDMVVTLWAEQALALDRGLKALVADGMELSDHKIAVQLEGNFVERTVQGRQRRSFKVDAYTILTGPTAELHRQRSAATRKLAEADALVADGKTGDAFRLLRSYMAMFTNQEHLLTKAQLAEAEADVAVPVVEAPVEALSLEDAPTSLTASVGETVIEAAPVVETAVVDAPVEATALEIAAPVVEAPAEEVTASEPEPAVEEASVATLLEALRTETPLPEVPAVAATSASVVAAAPSPVAVPAAAAAPGARFGARSTAPRAAAAAVDPELLERAVSMTRARTTRSAFGPQDDADAASPEQRAQQTYADEPAPSVAAVGLSTPPRSGFTPAPRQAPAAAAAPRAEPAPRPAFGSRGGFGSR